jgi:NTP pyrophosphatase (non-canonical NTP hydrolase)
MGYDIWEHVAVAKGWLDANQKNPGSEDNLTIRVLKMAEEAGEAAGALIEARGQNPRKATGAWSHVADETCDVVITALVTLATQLGSAPAARAYLEEFALKRRVRLDALLEAERAARQPDLALF